MNTKSSSYSIYQSVALATAFVGVLWVIQSAGVLFDLQLNALGIMPLDLSRWWGVFTAPLVHGSYEHLFNNTLPLIVLGSALLYGYPSTRWWVIGIVWVVSGIGIWCFGREAVHLGASGIGHGLFFYLLVVAILRRDARSVGLMMIAFFMYGGMIMTIFPRDPQISFEAHFFGAFAGFCCALFFWKFDPAPEIKRYRWEGSDDPDPVIGDLWQQQPENQDAKDRF